ncbi:uncharacterized protein LOC113980546, partial [Neopelma chrysocephalum]|uniref:uncharacterized protein LOC113980546 n=1 Tax=Neopelma chrysocephalum TaxID=114329 RepID=UPI000FCD1D5D
AFLKFLGIRRRRTTTAPTEVVDQPEPSPTEFEADPDVTTALTDGTGNWDTPLVVHTAKSDPALTAMPNLTAEADAAMTEGIADADLMPRESANSAPTADIFEDNGVSSPKQVPAFVRNLHQRLTASQTLEKKLLTEFLGVTEAHPDDVVVTLLRCAPSCDRAAAILWKTIASSAMTMEKVLPKLLRVMENWPRHSTSTSDGDNTHVFGLA